MLFSREAQAPTPPETLLLREHKQGLSQTDPVLDKWLQQIREGRQPQTMSDAEFQNFVKGLDRASRVFFQLQRNGLSVQGREQAETVLRELSQPDSSWSGEAMLPYVLLRIADLPSLDPKNRQLARSLLRERGGLSCPRKRVILQDLRALDRGSLRSSAARDTLALIGEFRSLSFQEEALRVLLTGMSPTLMAEIRTDLQTAIRPFPRLIASFPQLFEDGSGAPSPKGALASLFQAERRNSQDACEEAQSLLLQGIQDDREQRFLPMVESVAMKIEGCWRSKGDRLRLTYWQEMQGPLRDQYGFRGESLARRRLGLVHWGRDDFEAARKIFSLLLLEAERDFPDIHAETLFTYARIIENEGRFEEAIEKYRFFTELYREGEQSNQAMTSLIVLSTLLKRQDEALKFALDLIEREVLRAADDRDVASLSLALYWTGKMYLERNDRKRAQFYWERLAQEFYSTFYGALAHYSLERMTGKRFLLPPVHTPHFDRNEMFKDFAAEDRKILERAERLLMAGMREEAGCEIKEIPTHDDETHRQLAKAVFLYAAGDWLSAVRIYQNLAKSYRLALPRGMERVLFPVAYSESVDQYAKKLGIEPSFIHAIIRQESVFNPRAQSSVGARGLMQLMPGTARMEARAIRSDLVTPEKLPEIAKVLKDETVLSNPELNIILGVQHVHRLFQKYKNPVFVLTSYNANPRATERWIDNISSDDMIVFIERIPYRETRSYVKLVMRNYFYYKRWYEGPEASLPLLQSLLPKELADGGSGVYQATSVDLR